MYRLKDREKKDIYWKKHKIYVRYSKKTEIVCNCNQSRRKEIIVPKKYWPKNYFKKIEERHSTTDLKNNKSQIG